MKQVIPFSVAFAVVIFATLPVEAQTKPRAVPQTKTPARTPIEVRFRGFADIGATSFAADRSFQAVLGINGGPVFGGGGEVVLARHIFFNVRASRFSGSGERLFEFNGTQFGLGIPTTVTITPVEFNGGYRFESGVPIVPYGGAGLSWHRYRETSKFADGAENVSDLFAGYQLLGGVEFGMARWIAGAMEVQWTSVPDALGRDANSVAGALGESNLGGKTFRVKVIVGN
jgi:opacity protein-like surface antigen